MDTADNLTYEINEILKDELYEEVTLVGLIINKETREYRLIGNGCVPCNSKIIKEIAKEMKCKEENKTRLLPRKV